MDIFGFRVDKLRFKLFFVYLREAPHSRLSGGGWEVSEGREGETDWRLKTDFSPFLSDLRSKLLSTSPATLQAK